MRRCGTSRRRGGPSRFAVTRSDARRRSLLVGARPDDNVVEHELVRRRGSRLEPFDYEERVVMPLDVEGARAVPEHADLARLRRLDPDRRRLGSDVAEKRPDEQVGDPGGPRSPLVCDLFRNTRHGRMRWRPAQTYVARRRRLHNGAAPNGYSSGRVLPGVWCSTSAVLNNPGPARSRWRLAQCVGNAPPPTSEPIQHRIEALPVSV